MSASPRVAIRADGDSALGLGHLRRCWTLANTLIQDGHDVRFVRQRKADGISGFGPDIPTSWFDDVWTIAGVDSVNGELKDADATLAIIGNATSEMSWVVVDHYGLSSRWEAKIREAGHRVLVIDDLRHRRHCADVLVSDSLAPFVPSMNDCPTDEVQLVGFPYALLDPEFTFDSAVPVNISRRPTVLVTFGGSDPTGETAKVCLALQELRGNHVVRSMLGAVDVVVGPGNLAQYGLTEMIARCGARAHRAPQSLASLMQRADLVITAGGNTMVEALALRKPCLIAITAANQQLLTEQLVARNLVKVVGWHQSSGPQEIASALSSLVEELPAFTSHVRASPVFDHLGSRRIVLAMREISGKGRVAVATGVQPRNRIK